MKKRPVKKRPVKIPNVKIPKTHRRLIWENPLRLEFIVGKRHDGGDDELRILIRLDPGPKPEKIFMTRKSLKIKDSEEGAKILRRLLRKVVRYIPKAHKGQDWVMTYAQIDKIVAEVEKTGHSTTSDWATANTPQPMVEATQG